MPSVSPQSTVPRLGRQWPGIAGSMAIITAYALVNFAMYPILDRTSRSVVNPLMLLAAGICLGIIGSQIGALVQRWSLAVGAFSCGCSACGAWAFSSSRAGQQVCCMQMDLADTKAGPGKCSAMLPWACH